MAKPERSTRVVKGDYDYEAPRMSSNMPIDPRLENLRNGLVEIFYSTGVEELIKLDEKYGIYPSAWTEIRRRSKAREILVNWVITMITHKSPGSQDPIFPLPEETQSLTSQLRVELANNLRKSTPGMTKEDAKTITSEIVDELLSTLLGLVKHYHGRVQEWVASCPGGRPAISRHRTSHGITLIVRGGEKFKEVKLSHKTDERLNLLWKSSVPFIIVRNKQGLYDLCVYCLLLRYDTLDPSALRQGSLPEAFTLDLNMSYGVNFEMFAGATNSAANSFCSLFPDVERLFGSYGNMFDLKPRSGFYQANPPLIETITTDALEKISEWLMETEQPLSFILFTPPWDGEDSDSYVNEYKGIGIFKERGQLSYTFDPDGYVIRYVDTDTDVPRKPRRAPRISVVQNDAGRERTPVGVEMRDLILKHIGR